MAPKTIILIVVWALLCSMVAACQGETSQLSESGQLPESGQLSESDCEKVDRKRWPWEPDLIDRAKAEKVAFWALSIYSPETTPVEIETVVAACLTTLGWYERVLTNGASMSNPDLEPPNMPIWIIQVKGKSRTASPMYENETYYYDYALATVNARSGEIMEQSYLSQPLLVP